jgi:hypothetical protein
LDAELFAGAHNTNGNLAPIGDQDFMKQPLSWHEPSLRVLSKDEQEFFHLTGY